MSTNPSYLPRKCGICKINVVSEIPCFTNSEDLCDEVVRKTSISDVESMGFVWIKCPTNPVFHQQRWICRIKVVHKSLEIDSKEVGPGTTTT